MPLTRDDVTRRFDPSSGLVLDGGLATELERDGHDLGHPLWSAHLLLTAPDAIRAVHRRYLDAGADCISTATYQASLPGLAAHGLPEPAARALFVAAVDLAVEERDAAHARHGGAPALVAASIGPYGAYLADGSEFRGRYGLTRDALYAFHAPRWSLLKDTDADVLAFETVPDLDEIHVIADLLANAGGKPGWISVVAADEGHLCDGTPIETVAKALNDIPELVAMGVNCSAPRHVAPLLRRARAAGFLRPFVVYPNSGEMFDPSTRGWVGSADLEGFVDLASQWRALGAVGVGGCCRTGPEHVRALRAARP